MKLFRLPYCEECGESRVPHHLERWPQLFEEFIDRSPRIVRFMRFVENGISRVFGFIFPASTVLLFMEVLADLYIAEVRTKAKVGDSTRALALYDGAEATGVTLYTLILLGLPVGFVAEKKVQGKKRYVGFNVIPRPTGFVSPSLEWMDDKGLLKSKLKASGIPTADGGSVRTEEEAVALFKSIGRPVIAKPFRGSRGRHTTLDIRTEEELRRAFRVASLISIKVVIETYLHGTVHRVTLVGGEPVAVARREYPHVIGDGIHTVSALIDIENTNPMRDGVHYRKLDKFHRVAPQLMKQRLTLDSIPEVDQVVILSDKNSRLHGTVTEDITSKVHPENINLFRRLGAVLGDPIVGVDFMIDDMTKPWTEQKDAGVLECNSMPFIDVHHKVVSGETINVGKYLWEEIFSPKYQ